MLMHAFEPRIVAAGAACLTSTKCAFSICVHSWELITLEKDEDERGTLKIEFTIVVAVTCPLLYFLSPDKPMF